MIDVLIETETFSPFAGEFDYKGEHFWAVITPESFSDDGGIDFTGNYSGTLTGSKGTSINFELFADTEETWETDPKDLDPELVANINKIVKEFRKDGGKEVVLN